MVGNFFLTSGEIGVVDDTFSRLKSKAGDVQTSKKNTYRNASVESQEMLFTAKKARNHPIGPW